MRKRCFAVNAVENAEIYTAGTRLREARIRDDADDEKEWRASYFEKIVQILQNLQRDLVKMRMVVRIVLI